MNRSENIADLAAALAKAQGEMRPAPFDRVNPHFKSKYATLTSVMQTIQGPLSKNGLSIVQTLEHQGERMALVTKVLHCSGQWLADGGVPLLLDKSNMMGLGSAISFAKRYGVSAMLGIVSDEDDDGSGACAPEIKSVTHAPATAAQNKQADAAGGDLCCGAKMLPSQYPSKDGKPQLYCKLCRKSRAVASEKTLQEV